MAAIGGETRARFDNKENGQFGGGPVVGSRKRPYREDEDEMDVIEEDFDLEEPVDDVLFLDDPVRPPLDGHAAAAAAAAAAATEPAQPLTLLPVAVRR